MIKAEVIRRDAWQSGEAQGLVWRTINGPNTRRRDNADPRSGLHGCKYGRDPEKIVSIFCASMNAVQCT